ncbi:MAG TPA: ABC transporter ATP-binding protein [Gaiella sp.]|nr:ABC transporter ATP-binding protein [Gaiella sp.]
MSVLELEEIDVTYERRDHVKLKAVVGASLSVDRGQIVGLVGESGCGKSSLARAAVGLVAPTAGRVRFEGEDVAALTRRARPRALTRLQLVFQNPYSSLNPRRRVGEQIADGLTGDSGRRAGRSRRVGELLELVGLSAAAAQRYPSQFSGGQRQRIAIARALAADPSLIVLDEPLASLDASAQAQVANLLVQLSRELSLGLLLISHDLAIVRHTAEVHDRIVETGPTREVWSAPLHPYTEALIAAVPRPDGTGTMPDALPGEVPDPARPPTGCRFHPRCPHRFSRCPEEEPQLEHAFTARTVACWLPRDPTPTPPSRRTAHTTSTASTNDSPARSSQEEGVMPTHKGGTA